MKQTKPIILRKGVLFLVVLFCISLGIRVAYIADGNVKERPLGGDARWYDLGARGFKSIVQNFNQLGVPLLKGDLDERKRAELGMNNDAKGFFRCPLVSFTFGLIFLIFGENLLHIHIFHILVSSSSILLIYLIGKAIHSHKVGFYSALIAILYTPFIKIDGAIESEPIAVFVVLGVIYCGIRAISSAHPKRYVVFGASLFFLMIARAAFKFSFIFFLIVGFIIIWRTHKKNWITCMVFFTAGFLVCLLLWMILTNLIVGTPLLGSYSRKGGDLLYRGSNIHVEGYHTDYPGAVHTKEFREASRHSRDYNEACSKAVKTFYKEHFRESVILRIAVSSFLWREPAFRTPMRTKVITLPPMVHWHRFLVVMGLLGFFLFLFCHDWRMALLLAVPIVYSMGIYLTLGYEHRFNVTSMPFVILFAVFQISFLWGTVRKLYERFRKKGRKFFNTRQVMKVVFPFICFWILFFVLRPGIVFSILSFSSIRFLFHCSTLLGLVAFFFSWLLLREVYRWRKVKGNIQLASVLPVFLLSISFAGWRMNDRNWDEWKSVLCDRDESILQEIHLPSNLDVSQFEEPMVKVDMLGGLGKGYDVVVTVNEMEVKRYVGGLKSDSVKFENSMHPELFQSAAKNFNKHYSTDTYGEEDFRQWFSIPFELSLIDPTKPLKIEIRLEGEVDCKENYLHVYGDYLTTEENVFRGPSFAHTPFETSRWKFWAFLSNRQKADNRLQKATPLRSVKTVSSYHDGRAVQYDDLSNELGRQSGQYRIRLQLKHWGGYYVRTDESGKQRVVWTIPEEGDIPVSQDYLAGRIQRQADDYFSGYEIF